MIAADWRVQVLGSASSTQDLVRDLAETMNEPEGLAIQAMQQVKGRGRHGHAWTSPMGNLYLSMLLRPACKAMDAGQLAFVTGVALSEAIDEVIDGDAHTKTLKWPNDILIDGRKVSGILLESKLKTNGMMDYVIVGVGVNIFAPPEGAVSLDQVKKQPVYVNKFRDAVLDSFARQYTLWQEKGFAPIREAWLKQAHGINDAMSIRLPEITYSGIFRGVDEQGALMADVGGELKRFTAGEVHFGIKDHVISD